MSTKDFNCKKEEVIAITGIVLNYYLRDLVDFSNFSPDFTAEFGEEVRAKRDYCLAMTTNDEVKEEMKSITQRLPLIIKEIRLKINKVEGHLDLAEKSLDLPVAGFDISGLRKELSDKNIPAIVMQGNTFYKKLQRNEAALTAKGMKSDFLPSLKGVIDELDGQKITQKSKKSERIYTTESNTNDLNELWEMTTKILRAAHSIYRGENDLKLKDYTMTHLKKQIRTKPSDNKGTDTNPAGE